MRLLGWILLATLAISLHAPTTADAASSMLVKTPTTESEEPEHDIYEEKSLRGYSKDDAADGYKLFELSEDAEERIVSISNVVQRAKDVYTLIKARLSAAVDKAFDALLDRMYTIIYKTGVTPDNLQNKYKGEKGFDEWLEDYTAWWKATRNAARTS